MALSSQKLGYRPVHTYLSVVAKIPCPQLYLRLVDKKKTGTRKISYVCIKLLIVKIKSK
jgi:hypothetical protein